MSQPSHPKKRRPASKSDRPNSAPTDATLHAFGATLRRARLAQGLTQAELAHHVGFDRSYIGRLERGAQNPPLLTLYRLANALHCAIADLMIQADL